MHYNLQGGHFETEGTGGVDGGRSGGRLISFVCFKRDPVCALEKLQSCGGERVESEKPN